GLGPRFLYALGTLLLLPLAVVCVATLQWLVLLLVDQRLDIVASVLATVVLVALAQPWRVYLRRVIDWLYYPERDPARKVLARFARRVRDLRDVQPVLEATAAFAADALRRRYAVVFRPGPAHSFAPAAASGWEGGWPRPWLEDDPRVMRARTGRPVHLPRTAVFPLVIPLSGPWSAEEEVPTALLALGPRAGEELVTAAADAFLLDLGRHMGLAIARALLIEQG